MQEDHRWQNPKDPLPCRVQGQALPTPLTGFSGPQPMTFFEKAQSFIRVPRYCFTFCCPLRFSSGSIWPLHSRSANGLRAAMPIELHHLGQEFAHCPGDRHCRLPRRATRCPGPGHRPAHRAAGPGPDCSNFVVDTTERAFSGKGRGPVKHCCRKRGVGKYLSCSRTGTNLPIAWKLPEASESRRVGKNEPGDGS